MNTTYKSHGNQQPSLDDLKDGSTTIPGGGVEPSGSKREASVKADGEIVCSAFERCRRATDKAKSFVTKGLQLYVHGHFAT